ncbi:MAG: site-specific integrase [Caulobacteraceae bacterium]|nr:site-specific integrase [Caulobacteraceae bacterium]
MRLDAAEGRLGEAAQLTLDEAVDRYWLEHAQHRGDAADTERRLERLLTLIPKTTRLADIRTETVSAAIQRRRAQAFVKAKPRVVKGALRAPKPYLPSNATVNRDVIQTLRPVLHRARVHWGARGLPEIAWGELALPVPRETVRVYSTAEQDAWREACGPTAALALRLILTYGLRFGELFFPLDAFQAEGPRLAWMKGRKLDVPHTIPLLAADAGQVAARVGRARKAQLDHIWYVEVVRRDGAGEDQVELEALSYYALQGRLRAAATRAGINGGRVIHGARHHAGTTIQRASGNMKTTQRLLGHLDPKSTQRYVHAMDDDVRTALEAVEKSRNSPEPPKPDTPERQAG